MKFKFIRFDETSKIPETLYHGALGIYETLMSGFARTGELVKWDQTESNEFLYATSSREEAISQGFASAVEKRWLLNRYQTSGHRITISIEPGSTLPTLAQLKTIDVYLYTIHTSPDQDWKKNTNEFNGLDTEYKTAKNIYGQDFRQEKVNIAEWLLRKNVSIKINPQGKS